MQLGIIRLDYGLSEAVGIPLVLAADIVTWSIGACESSASSQVARDL